MTDDSETFPEIKSDLDMYEYVGNVIEKLLEIRSSIVKEDSISQFQEMIEYHGLIGGKALRPSLGVLISDALGGNKKRVYYFALAVELVHNGSLVLDDIIDGDKFRRGIESVQERFKVGKSLLFGNLLATYGVRNVFKPMKLLTPPDNMNDIADRINLLVHTNRAAMECSDALLRLVEGAFIEHTSNAWEEEDHLKVLSYKTGALYEVSARMGAIVSDVPKEIEDACGILGMSVGMAFQLTDDLVDIAKSKRQKKPVGDITEGKISLPFIYLRRVKPELIPLLDRYASKRFTPVSVTLEPLTDEEVMKLIDELYSSECMKLAQMKINKFINATKKACYLLPQNEYTKALYNFAEFCCESLVQEINSDK